MATIVDGDGTRIPRDKAAGLVPARTDVWTDEWVQAAEIHVRVPLNEGEGAKVDTAALQEAVRSHLAASGISGADHAEAYLVARMS